MIEPVRAGDQGRGWRGLVTRASVVALEASLKVSPRPMARVIRKRFADGVAQRTASLLKRAPIDIVSVLGESYGRHRDAKMDVYVPASGARPGSRLPTIVWTHGGAFVGGSKEELAGYFKIIADAGFTVVGVGYSLAPGATYPTPVRQLGMALRHLQANADRLHVDPTRLVLAGDSAGSHISAQLAAIVTNPEYAQTMAIKPTLRAEHLCGIALCCGIYNLATDDDDGSPLASFLTAIGWSYAGKRAYRNDDRFIATVTLENHVTDAFPPAFLTAGNADPLASQSEAFASALRRKGIDVETMFYDRDHQPQLPHEYQFDLDLYDGHAALERLVGFFRRQTMG
jgi:acetyl esterase